jgi:hypothetical protein
MSHWEAPPASALRSNRDGCLIFVCGLGVAGMLVLALTIGVSVWWLYRKIEEEQQSRHTLPPFGEMSDEEFQTEVARGFRQKAVGISSGTLRSIERFFREASGQRDKDKDSPVVRRLIDGERALEQIERSPNCVKLSRDDRTSLQEMPFPYNPFEQAGLPPRIVHVDLKQNRREAVVWGYSPDGVPMRWWLIRAVEGWKLFDWEDSETGRRETEEIAIKYCMFYRREAAWDFFVALANESDGVCNNPYDADALRRLEAINVTALDERVFDDGVMRAAFAYYHRRNYRRCLELCDLVKRPRIRPDVERLRSFCLQQLERWEEAAQSAQHYEELLGPTPVVLAVRARALARLSRRAEAEGVWRRVLSVSPTDLEALAGWAEALPEDRKHELVGHLRAMPDFQRHAQKLVEQLCAAEDEVAARSVAEWLAKTAPDTRESLEAAADLKNFDEDFAAAGALYLASHAKATTDEDRSRLLYAYLEAMAAAGRQVEAHAQAPDKRAVLEALWWDYRDDGIYELTREKLKTIVAAHKQSDPEDRLLPEIEASLLSDEERHAESEKILLSGLASLKQQPDADREETLRYALVDSLLNQGKWQEALSQRPQEHSLIAITEQLIALDRLGDARAMVDHVQQESPADAALPLCRATLLRAEKKYAAAWNALPPPTATGQGDESPDWRLNQLVSDLVVMDETLLPGFVARKPGNREWDTLATGLKADDRWDTLFKVVELWRGMHPSEPDVLYWEAIVKSHAKDHTAVAALLTQPLAASPSTEFPEYRRAELHLLLVESLLDLQRLAKARQHGQHVLQAEANSGPLLRALLAAGDVAAIEEVAAQGGDSYRSWSSLPYHEPRFAALLADERFLPLRRNHPPPLEYEFFDDSVTLLLAQSEPLSPDVVQERIAAALPEATVRLLAIGGAFATIQTLEVLSGDERWLIHLGSEPYVSRTEVEELTIAPPLRQAAASHRTWIEIGRQGRPQATPVSAMALAAALKPPPGAAIYFGTANRLVLWDDALAKQLPAGASEDALEEMGEACYLEHHPSESHAVSGRDWRAFLRAYRQRSADSKPFRVKVEMALGSQREPLWIAVTGLEGTSPSRAVIGTAENDSLLYPNLKAGEPRHIDRYRVRAVSAEDVLQ